MSRSGILSKRSHLQTVSSNISLENACGSYKCGKCVRGVHFYNGLMMILDMKAFCGLLEGSLGNLLFLVGLETLFHPCGRRPNHDDFLLQFI